MNYAGIVLTMQPPIKLPVGVTAIHKRATVTGAANSLGAYIGGAGIPRGTESPTVFPHAVLLQVESADAANKVFICGSGLAADVPAATLGFELPAAPGQILIEAPWQLSHDINDNTAGIQLFCAGTSHVQCWFLF